MGVPTSNMETRSDDSLAAWIMPFVEKYGYRIIVVAVQEVDMSVLRNSEAQEGNGGHIVLRRGTTYDAIGIISFDDPSKQDISIGWFTPRSEIEGLLKSRMGG